MQYMAIIYTPASTGPDPAVIQAYGAYTKEMIVKGFFKQGDALQNPDTATCVSVRDGKNQVKAGSFPGGSEQLSGYYILECANIDLAIDCASKIPGAKNGTVELRPILLS